MLLLNIDPSILVSPPALEPLAIPYQANQPMDSQLWDSNFNSVFLFGTNEFLVSNTKNITCVIPL